MRNLYAIHSIWKQKSLLIPFSCERWDDAAPLSDTVYALYTWMTMWGKDSSGIPVYSSNLLTKFFSKSCSTKFGQFFTVFQLPSNKFLIGTLLDSIHSVKAVQRTASNK